VRQRATLVHHRYDRAWPRAVGADLLHALGPQRVRAAESAGASLAAHLQRSERPAAQRRALSWSRANARPDVVAIGAHEDLFPRTARSPHDFRGVAARAVVERCEVALQRLKELARLAQPSFCRCVLRRAAAPRLPSPLGEYGAARRTS